MPEQSSGPFRPHFDAARSPCRTSVRRSNAFRFRISDMALLCKFSGGRRGTHSGAKCFLFSSSCSCGNGTRQTARPSAPRGWRSYDRKALTVFPGGCGSGRRGFVSRFFSVDRGLWLLGYRHYGRRLDGGCWLGGPRADAWVAGLLQFAERTVRAFVDAVESGFVTGGERNGARLVH